MSTGTADATQVEYRTPDRTRGIARTVVGIALLALATAVFANVDVWLAWDDANEFLGRGRLLLYFTTQSNLLAAAAYAVVGIQLLRGRVPGTGIDLLRGLATVDMAVTGLVYGALLADPRAPWTWSEFLLHQGGPVIIVVWWLVMPPAAPVPWRAAAIWLAHPVVWTACVLTYASESSDRWTPYFFLDPEAVGGWPVVVGFVVVLHAVLLATGLLAVLAARRLPWREAVWRRLRA